MSFIIRMVAREMRAAWQRLLFFFVCIAVGVGAHALWGAVLSYYTNHGAAGGSLGLPTSDVTDTGDGTIATFQNGTVTCDTGGVCSQS